MRVTRWAALLATSLVIGSSCTQTQDRPSTPDRDVRDTSASLASGERLPRGCTRDTPKPAQTVAFVADGRAWALDPDGQRLTCLFKVEEPGPFEWGPQGDRVLLHDLEIRGLSADAPTFESLGTRPVAFDWGHPLGLAVVYSPSGERSVEKRYMNDGRVEELTSLPVGRYLDVAYHPSGEALAFVIKQAGEQSIWLSTNDGLDPVQLVHPEGGTLFTSIAFTPDGQRLTWTALHPGAAPAIHVMDLADRSTFTDAWTGKSGQGLSNLHLAPSGTLMAVDVGSDCSDRSARIVLSPRAARPAVGKGPSTVIGWLDSTTALIGVGGCDELLDLVAVDATGERTPLVLGADVAATRTVVTSAPDFVPEPASEEEEPPPTGVG